jgi:hypothetical protein
VTARARLAFFVGGQEGQVDVPMNGLVRNRLDLLDIRVVIRDVLIMLSLGVICKHPGARLNVGQYDRSLNMD